MNDYSIIIIAYAAIGLIAFFSAFSAEHKQYRALLLTVGIIGIIGTAIFFVNIKVQSENLFNIAALGPAGLMLLALGMNTIISFFKCTLPVSAEYIGYQSSGGKGIKFKFPQFRYQYKNESFVTQSFVSYSSVDFNELYGDKTKNKEITIYVNPRNPDMCVDKRKTHFARPIIVASFGLVCIVFLILSLL